MGGTVQDPDAAFGAGAEGRVAALIAQEPAATVFRAFNVPDEGVETRLVGGAVRNALAGLAPGDLDFATTGEPDATVRLAEAAELKALPTGVEHGTVTVMMGERPVEITTLRQDVETHGRKATVAFGTDWEADAQRRDFTVNAFYVDANGTLFDPVGGAADLRHRRLRFIGDARARVREDYLRSLRYFRFMATFDAESDDAALRAIAQETGGLGQLSAERVHKELFLLLGAEDPVEPLALMQAYGVLADLLGSAPVVPRVARLRAWEEAFALNADPLMRLTALAIHVDLDAVRLQARLRLSKVETAHIFSTSRHWWLVSPDLGAAGLKEALYRLGADAFRARLAYAWLQTAQSEPDDAWRAAYELADRWRPPEFPVSGEDIVQAGTAAGPKVGALLAKLERVWIDSDYALSKADLLARLKA